ncbi:2702_t:CDS:1 [Paraglomus brasilianum]|uniref:2702_t:CDS:1 n=1 Tax=Paraglomus brasilianum TaxID=144538 RepID=A0A9N9GP43_9GLOM|nr:2702_t:CDS:1 [Paraglomus brasilianum]
MSLEIRPIGEVISYQATSRTEFVVGMGVVKSKTSKNESITFTIIQFIPVDAEDTCYVTSLVPKNVVYFYGTVTRWIRQHSHSRKISLDPINRTKVYNVGSRVKVEGAAELHNNIIYCELQHVTFVILKNTAPTTPTLQSLLRGPLLSEAL